MAPAQSGSVTCKKVWRAFAPQVRAASPRLSEM